MIPALIFDLDDTLYPERQFIRSGYHAVATEVTRRFGLSRRAALATLMRALRHGNRGQAFQTLCREHDLPLTIVAELVETIRTHAPGLSLPPASAEALAAARARGWRLGVLTNGIPAVQARKAEALGLDALVDTIVYAHGCGTGLGKPAGEAFETVLARLGSLPSDGVFVGDDPLCDIAGARLAGLRTVQVRRRGTGNLVPPSCEPDVVVEGMDEVIAAVERLWRGEWAHAV